MFRVGGAGWTIFFFLGESSGLTASLGSLQITATYAVVFLALDQAVNAWVYSRSSMPFGARRLAWHVAYGTLNTKTYFVVVLGCLRGLRFDIAELLLASMLSYLYQVAYLDRGVPSLGVPCFGALFYVEHRIGHLPEVYAHAHKMHHFLHDTTPWDAHIYGNGLNEEFLWIVAETAPCWLWGAPPYHLNLRTLWSSFLNKDGHTRSSASSYEWRQRRFGPTADSENIHADHHTLHTKWFGLPSVPIYDWYFGTENAAPRRASSVPGGCVLRRERRGGQIRITAST